MSIDLSAFTLRAKNIININFIRKNNNEELITAYESYYIEENTAYYSLSLLVVTRRDNKFNYHYYVSDEYLHSCFYDDYIEHSKSDVLVTISKRVSNKSLEYIRIIPFLAKGLEPHFIGEIEAKQVTIQTGTHGYPYIIELVTALEYEFEGRKYNYRDVKDLIQYHEK
jgi:hypothetical protein